MPSLPASVLPAWLRGYSREDSVHDLLSSLTLMVILVPQALAYALLAGLPPQTGLYASLLPVVVYALTGSSAALAVGPAALPAMMTGAALIGFALPQSELWVQAAMGLALASGLLRVGLGALNAGFLANFLSQSVLGGFIAGSALSIMLSQVPAMLGLKVSAANAPELFRQVWQQHGQIDPHVVGTAIATLLLLWWGRDAVPALLRRLGLTPARASLLAKMWPVVVIILGAVAVAALGWPMRLVGVMPSGLPSFTWPSLSWSQWHELMPAIAGIALVGFVDSFSIAQTLALKRREKVSPNRELVALGLANVAAGVTGASPVSASFGRSATNEMAGARTQMAGVFCALWVCVLLVAWPSAFQHFPIPVLAATICMAVLQMFDLHVLRLAWRFDRREAMLYLATLSSVLLFGVLPAIVVGVCASLALVLWRSSHPHMAVLGRVPGTEHYRNVERYEVQCQPGLLVVRVDESLYFANARFVHEALQERLAQHPGVRRLLLVMSAVNAVDLSALDALQNLNRDLQTQGVSLYLAEVKGPVMDVLRPSGLLEQLAAPVFLSTHEAVTALSDAPQPSPGPTPAGPGAGPAA
ncbi:MAG: sulfate permease [Burkholderiaceae bacterium]|nr:MAG: sulfate permease [Burkholderiaceae bacterium]